MTEDVRLILDLDGRGTDGGAHVGFFGSDTGVTSGGIVLTAEPSSSMLMLAGVVVFASFIAWKRRRT